MGRKTKRRGNEPVNERQSGDPRDPASWGPADKFMPDGRKREPAPSPILNMNNQGVIDRQQLDAAGDIKTGYFCVLSGIMTLRAATVDDSPRGGKSNCDPSTHLIALEQIYKAWSKEVDSYNDRYRGKRPVHEAIVGVVCEEKPVEQVAREMGFDHRKIARLVRYGLEEYTYIAGWRRRQAA